MAILTQCRDLQNAFIVDEQVGCLHVSMQDLIVVQVTQAFQELEQVALNT